jgi:xylulose-5-phosphate/fructose-6-phosphate phosphoketolase
VIHRIDAHWRAASRLSVGQIYLFDSPLLKRPLALKAWSPVGVH